MKLILEKHGETWIAETPQDRQLLRELAMSAGCTVERLKVHIKSLLPVAEEVLKAERGR